MDLIINDSSNGSLTNDQIQTLKTAGIVPKDTPLDQILVFAAICKERGLSAFSKEIYLLGYNGKYSAIVGINGFRKIADRTGRLAGCDDAKFDLMPSGTYKTIAQYKDGEKPQTATVSVWKMVNGVRCEFSHTAKFSEFNTSQQKWASMPFQMLAKVAESHALRKAFSDVLGGLSDESELGAINGTIKANVSPEQLEQLIIEEVATCDMRGLGVCYAQHVQFIKERGLEKNFTDRKIALKNGL
jgi:phage recombination protein Bet